MKILLTGSEGQLGRALISSKPDNIQIMAKNKKGLDITNENECIKTISN